MNGYLQQIGSAALVVAGLVMASEAAAVGTVIPGTRLQTPGEDLPKASSPSRKTSLLSGNWELKAEPRPAPELKEGGWLDPLFAFPEPATSGTLTVQVPGVWQTQGLGFDYHTGAVYRRTFSAPEHEKDEAVWLKFGNVATRAEVILNGQRVGTHVGAWTPFEMEITPHLQPENELVVRVDEAPEHFTAGFVRHVAPSFGGIWGDVWLDVRPRVWVKDLFVSLPVKSTTAEARIEVGGRASLPEGCSVELIVTPKEGTAREPVRVQVPKAEGTSTEPLLVKFPAEGLALWHWEQPNLHRAQVRLVTADGQVLDEIEQPFGLRTTELGEGKLLLNGKPLYWAGILHWAVYPQYLTPGLTREEFRQEIRDLKRLGFNAINVCLFVFPKRFYEVADEEGMLVWQEYPLWLYFPGSFRPQNDEEREALVQEYLEMYRLVRSHPSVILHSLAVEDPEGDLALMQRLYGLCHEVIPGSIVQDNSAFLNQKIADFLDHHPYEELEGYAEKMQGWVKTVRDRGNGPFLFGEALDFDTFRDCTAILAALPDAPWWTKPEFNRSLIMPGNGNDFWGHTERQKKLEAELGRAAVEEIVRNSREHSWASRKYQIETSRQHESFAGMALTCIRDVLCTRPGIYDDLGQMKWSEKEVRRFNAQTLPLLKADRASHTYYEREPAKLEFSVSHYGTEPLRDATLECVLTVDDEAEATKSFSLAEIGCGTVPSLGVWELEVPGVYNAEPAKVTAQLTANGKVVADNEWNFWVFPQLAAGSQSAEQIHDPEGQFKSADLKSLRIPEGVLLASVLDERVTSHLKAGGRAVIVDPKGRAFPAHDTPFWREVAVERFDQTLFSGFPWTGAVDLQFFGLAGGRGYDVRESSETLPLLRTINGRHHQQNELVVETRLEGNRVVATTLNLPGESQPTGLDLLQRLLDRVQYAETDMYQNPLPVALADPFVLKEGDTWYLYGTSRVHQGFEVFTSKDMINWDRAGFCYRRERRAWADTDFWAPEVIKKDGKFYLFFTAKNREAGIRNICIATADSPLGPFKEVKAPLLPGASYIDPHVFKDPASGEWFFYVTPEVEPPTRIMGARLDDSLLELKTTLTQCLAADQEWERNWVEGAFLIEHEGWYYMTYSGCAFWDPRYAVGCAVAKHPLGPWTKPSQEPILKQNEAVHAPGHNCVIEAPDGKGLLIVYHRHKAPGEKHRYTAIDRLAFEPSSDGPDRLVCPEGPTFTPRRL